MKAKATIQREIRRLLEIANDSDRSLTLRQEALDAVYDFRWILAAGHIGRPSTLIGSESCPPRGVFCRGN